MRKLFEAEWQGETNPGGYQGPEVSDAGLVIDNSDEVTKVPETPAEKNARKRKKEQISREAAAKPKAESVKEETETEISLEDLLNDPSFIEHLMAELQKYHVDSQIEAKQQIITNLAHIALIEG